MKPIHSDVDTGSEIEYDLVIVGGGPSAIGLIYGLLLPYANIYENEHGNNKHGKKVNTKIPPFTIAVIERGASLDTPSLPDIQDPNLWFRAAHPSSLRHHHTTARGVHSNTAAGDSDPNNIDSHNHNHSHNHSGIASASSVEYQTVPQQGLGNRILSVPTGKGMGGGTNINACLVVRPPLDDFQNWPSFWTEPVPGMLHHKKGEEVANTNTLMPRIMAAVIKVEHEMRRNDALVQESCDGHGTQITTRTGADGKWVENKFEFEACIDDDDDDGQCLDLNHLCAVTSAVRKMKRGDDDAAKSGYYRRMNYYEGILKPFLDRNPHLKTTVTFMTGVQAERLVHHQHDVTSQIFIKGIDCIRVNRELGQDGGVGDGGAFTVKGKHIVLSAGAILTPSLLFVSGIGAEDELRKEGIEPILHGEQNQWGGIGKRLCDHVVTVCAYFAINPLSNGKRVNSVRGWLAADIHDSDGSGEKSQSTSRMMFNLTDGSSASVIIPSVIAGVFRRKYSFKPQRICHVVNELLRIAFMTLSVLLSFLLNTFPLRYLFSIHTMQILVCLMNPSSKGSVRIRRKRRNIDGAGMSCYYPEIDPQYLSDESDRRRLCTGWRVLRRFTHQWQLGKIEVLPGMIYRMLFGRAFLTRFHADFALPFYHWSGTCAMRCSLVGKNEYVVDEQLRVRNIANLHICDASVHPAILSVPPALTLAAMGLASSEIMQIILHKKAD